jgi:hypothetical protein
MSNMRDSMSNMELAMQNLDPMARNMANMDATTQHMAGTVALIQHSARSLDRSFGPMMGNFNRFMPFMGGGQRGYQGSPPPASPPPPPLVTPYPTYSMPQRPAQAYRPSQQWSPASGAASPPQPQAQAR